MKRVYILIDFIGNSATVEEENIFLLVPEQSAVPSGEFATEEYVNGKFDEANAYTDEQISNQDFSGFQSKSEKGFSNGYASLGPDGKVPLSEINDALLGNVQYQGTWNATTNTPSLTTVKPKGNYYITSVAGTFASFDFEVGDWIISNGTSWAKVDNTDAVALVAGLKGTITAAALRTALNIADGATANQSDAITNAAIAAASLNVRKYIYRNFTPSTTSNNTSGSFASLPVFYAIKIDANTFTVGSEFDVYTLFKHLGVSASTAGLRLYLNTTPLLSTGSPILMARSDIGTAAKSSVIKRTVSLLASNLALLYDPNMNAIIDDNTFNNDFTTIAFDPTVDNYIIPSGFVSNAVGTISATKATLVGVR